MPANVAQAMTSACLATAVAGDAGVAAEELDEAAAPSEVKVELGALAAALVVLVAAAASPAHALAAVSWPLA
jgi:hypothetical protein